jgi:hypothetical protein
MERHTLLSSNNPIDGSSGKVNKTKILMKKIEGNSDGDEIFLLKNYKSLFIIKMTIFRSWSHL